MARYGLIGEKLGHSFSKIIHESLGKYTYDLIEIKKENFHDFFMDKNFDAINVTIPYKQDVIPYLIFIDDKAKNIGAVNTVVNNDGKLYGYNTDYFGLKELILRNNFDLQNKKVLILGTGGTSKTAHEVCKDLGASKILKASRNTNSDDIIISYDYAYEYCKDFDFIVNTTPVGMHPNVDNSPIDLGQFTNLKGVIDVIYNPISTRLVIEARRLGIKAVNGLYMLVMQAIVASYYFLKIKDKTLDEYLKENKELSEKIFDNLYNEKINLVLIGMPGVGKSFYGEKMQKQTGKELVDTDKMIEEKTHMSPKDIIVAKGEEAFRDIESEVIESLKLKNNFIISTGGGAILRDRNVYNLKYNGEIILLDRDVNEIEVTDDRPLSDTKEKLIALYNQRKDRYRKVADKIINMIYEKKDK